MLKGIEYKYFLRFGLVDVFVPIVLGYLTNLLSNCQAQSSNHQVLLWFLFITTILLAVIFKLPEKELKRYIHIKRSDYIRWFVVFVVTGFLLDIVANFIKNQQWQSALIAFSGIVIIISVMVFLNPLSRKVENIAQWLRQQALQLGDLLWWLGLRLTSPFQFDYYQSLINKYKTFRGFKFEESDNRLPILDLAKVFVPLNIGVENLDNIVEANQRIWDFLALCSENEACRRIAIVASPGSGKSTLLEDLTLTYAKNTQRQQHPKLAKLIPIILYLRDICDEITRDKSINIAKLIPREVKNIKLSSHWFEKRLQNGECLVMLDGLDEVPSDRQRIEVSVWINQQIKLYPNTIFILTSRPFAYRTAPVEGIETVLEVQPFCSQQIQKFIQSWYLETEIKHHRRDDLGVRTKAQERAAELVKEIEKNQAIAAIASKPLLLSMIATVDYPGGYSGKALPKRRVELYEKICDVLLQKPLKVRQNKFVLQVLALKLMQAKRREFDLQTGCELIAEQLESVTRNLNPENFIKEIENHSSLLVEKEIGVYEFAHRSIQEYLAAVQLKDSNQEQLLIQNLQDPWWSETIRLYAAMGDANSLIEEAIKYPTEESLRLACDCLEEGLSVKPEVAKKLKETLEADTQNTEIISLAAKMQLSPRIKDQHLQLISERETRTIDMTLITSEQYQLFIEDKLKGGEYHQPDHWREKEYSVGDAKKPITGVRASDAIEFCEWLTQQHFAQGYKYRLPTKIEAENYPLTDTTDTSIGYWCWTDEGRQKLSIFGLDDSQKQAFIKQLADVLILYSELNPNLDFLFDLDLNYILRENFYGKINKFFDRKLYCDLYRVIDDDIYDDIDIKFNRELSRQLNLDLTDIINRDLNRPLTYELYQKLYHNVYRNLTLDFNLLINRDLYRNFFSSFSFFNKRNSYRDFYRNLYKKIDSGEASDFQILYFPLVLIIFICYLLSSLYQVASQKPEIHKLIHLTSQECRDISHKYDNKIKEIYPLYAFLALLEERRSQTIVAWEGIRIVRERI